MWKGCLFVSLYIRVSKNHTIEALLWKKKQQQEKAKTNKKTITTFEIDRVAFVVVIVGRLEK